MAHVQKRPGGRLGWQVRWRDGDGRHRARGYASRLDAEAAARAMTGDAGPQPHAVRRVDDEGEYYVGRYRDGDGEWQETEQFYTEQDALDEARDLAAGDGDQEE